MSKKYSWKFWFAFWLVSTVLLAGWFIFLQIKYRNIDNLKSLAKLAPVGAEKRAEIQALSEIYSEINGEKTLLVLFQNDLELRPGGGFIGAFGVVKMKNGKIADTQVFDTGNFDKDAPNTEEPPAPLKEILGTQFWKMCDSNWSPDFKTNAERAEKFYHLGGGAEKIDGVIAINTLVLDSILEITGPVKIDGYPGQYTDETAILQLEYQVEKGYLEQGIEKSERKNIMGELAGILAEKAHNFSFSEQFRLAKKLEAHLKRKDIQLFFKNEDLQKKIENINWGGRVKGYSGDYLMIVDANMLALKSDFCIKRKMDYKVDLSGDTPKAELKITYEHTCRVKDWMTSNYRDWLRVYAPEGSFLTESSGQNGEVQYSEELGKKVFGAQVFVPVGETKTITLKYQPPKSVKSGDYHLLVQKQSGSGDVPIEITVKYPDGREVKAQEDLNGDREFGF